MLGPFEMTITALAVKFFDEIAIAFAWYEYRNLDRTKIIEYIGRLFAHPGYRQPPLPALGVPAEAWKLDKDVDDDSQKILKSAITFLLLHEVAHWRFRHAGYDAISYLHPQLKLDRRGLPHFDPADGDGVQGRRHSVVEHDDTLTVWQPAVDVL